MRVVELAFDYDSKNGFHTLDSYMKCVKIGTWEGFNATLKEVVEIIRNSSTNAFLSEILDSINRLNPDVIITKGGDALHFAALDKLAKQVGFDFNLSRKNAD